MKIVFSALLPAIFLCLILNPAVAALTQDPDLNWRTLYTEHFAIHFHDNEEPLAHRVGNIAERVHITLTRTFNWTPRARTQIVLSDRFDMSNGSTTPFPRNEINLIVMPPDDFSVLNDTGNWLESLITHEYAHALHLDKASGAPKQMRNIFGRLFLLFPNVLAPPWTIEGIATYQETDKARGIGRGQSTLFRALMRLEVVHGLKPVTQVNQPMESWPANASRYLYGVYFYNFIAERYGEDKIQALINQYSNNLMPFRITTNSQHVVGKKLEPLWDEFEESLRQQFAPEIDAIRERGESPSTKMTISGYFTGPSVVSAEGDVYFLENDMASEPSLMVLKKGESVARTVAESRGRYLDYHPQAGILLTEGERVKNTNVFSDIYRVNPATGEKRRLTWGGRYRYATWSPDGQHIIAVHYALGRHALHLLDGQGNMLETLWQGTDDTVPGPPDWSPDGSRLVLSVKKPGEDWNLALFDITQRQWRFLTRDAHIEMTPRFSADGHSILFSADYDGVYNLQRLDLRSQRISTLTRVLGGAFSPYPSADGLGVYYTGLGVDGYDVYYLAASSELDAVGPDIMADAGPAEAPRQPLAQMDGHAENHTTQYDALSRIAPTSWFPYWRADEGYNEFGITTWGRDPLARHQYSLLAGYDLDGRWGVGQLNYIYDRWNPTLKFFFQRQVLAHRDANNNIERYRNSDTVSAEALWPFLKVRRQWLLHLGLVSETESDKDIRSGLGPTRNLRDRLAGVALSFNSARHYARAISPSNGRQLRLIAEDNDLLNSQFSGQVYIVDWREFIKLPGLHVLAARVIGGWGTDAPRRFSLGGALDNSISALPATAAPAAAQRTFGHRSYPLRGYASGRADLRGRRMALLEVEWRFPIALIERGLMSPPVGINRIHGAVFYNWGEAWDTRGNIPALRRGAGAEVTTELVLGYWLPLDLRVGYARGFDVGGTEQVYLEVGASF
ncbi:MAG: hypothetical protein GXP17_05120 [Gammaproteobacteria bacterium]|nr:hypothetical protein [Gammaproteobacteria bacterium]